MIPQDEEFTRQARALDQRVESLARSVGALSLASGGGLPAPLASLGALSIIADTLPYGSGVNTFSLTPFTGFGRSLIDDSSAAVALGTLGFSAFVATLVDDANAAAFMTTLGISSFAQLLLNDNSASAMRTRIGAVIGADVQAYDLTLDQAASPGADYKVFRARSAATGGGEWDSPIEKRTTLPGSPYEGQVISYLAVATGCTSVRWQLQWDSGTNRWYHIGGPPLIHSIDTEQAIAATFTTFQDLATVGPTIAVPRPGQYWAETRCYGLDTSAALNLLQAGLKNAAGAADGLGGALSTIAASGYEQLSGGQEITVAAAADVVKMQYRSINNAVGKFGNRRLTLLPLYIT